MMDLIDREALDKTIWSKCEEIDGLMLSIINNAPIVDAVEVVRCKYCRRERYCKFTQYQGKNGYCSLAESKDGD